MKKKSQNRQDMVYRLALAGICSAVALLLVWLSVIIRFSTIAFYVAAGCVLMVPISKKYYISSIFAYIASASLAFVIVGDITKIIGFVLYFGPMSILTALLIQKKVKWYFSLPFKILAMNGALALMYYVFGTIMIDASILHEIHYAVVAVVGTVGLVLIDFVMQMVYTHIIPRVSGVIRNTRVKDETVIEVEDVENPFEDDELYSNALIFDNSDTKSSVNANENNKEQDKNSDNEDLSSVNVEREKEYPFNFEQNDTKESCDKQKDCNENLCDNLSKDDECSQKPEAKKEKKLFEIYSDDKKDDC